MELKINKYFTLVIVVLVIIRMSTIGVTISDENVYWMMGQLVMQGYVPYQDFFFAHPVLFLLLSPLTYNIVTLRIGLLLVQIGILIFMWMIMKEYKFSETKRILTMIAYVFTTNFFHTFNFYLGFGLCTLFMLASYYAYLRKKYYLSIALAGVSILVRLFALFYIIPMTLITLKKLKGKYILSLVPLGIITLLIPGMLYSVFLYHVDSETGKMAQPDFQKFNTLISFGLMNGAILLLMAVKRPELRSGMIWLCCLVGAFAMQGTYYTYVSLCIVWMYIGVGAKCNKKELLTLIALNLVLFIQFYSVVGIRDYANMTMVEEISGVIMCNSEGRQLTGHMAVQTLVSIMTGVPLLNTSIERAGIVDTAFFRHFGQYNEGEYYKSAMRNQSHLMVYLVHESYILSIDWFINLSDYEVIYNKSDWTIVKSKW